LKVEEELAGSDDNILNEVLSDQITDSAFVPLSLLQLEEHEDTTTPPFSVCKYLLETTASRVNKGDSWPVVAKEVAAVRETLPEHVRSSCDAFIKKNTVGFMSLLQVSDDDDDDLLNNVAAEADSASSPAQSAPTTGGASQQELFRKFWEDKGKYCGACLTLTKKIQKWVSMNCTQALISERIMRMCGTLTGNLRTECDASRPYVEDYVVHLLMKKFPLPNHCAYIGLCEKTMVIRALQNPMALAEKQNALIQAQEGSSNLVQEGEVVLQKAFATPNTAPEITFDLSAGDVSYRDVDKASGEGLPKIFMDGTTRPASELRSDAFVSLLETESKGNNIFDTTNPDDPHVTLNAQTEPNVNVPVMHADLTQTIPHKINPKNYGLQPNSLPQDIKLVKACAACQFAIGSLFEFLSNPRTMRTILPQIKKACGNCNSPEEVTKCEEFVEMHGVSFYQDVVKQATPSKWCPKIKLCEMQYFILAPTVLNDNYARIKDDITQVSDF